MWTSSSTTSGFSRRIAATASSTVPASARTSTRPSSSARTPARKSSWSSTITTLGSCALIRPRSPALRGALDRQLDLGPAAGSRSDLRAPARPLHPADDRLAHAAAVGGHGGEVESRPAVADEDLDPRRPRPPRRRGSGPAPAACLAAFSSASRAAPSTASAARRARSRRRRRPRRRPGARPRPPRRRRAAPRRSSPRPSRPPSPASQSRSSRSWRRASAATSRGSSARFCIRVSVCSTESCRCAASSARSWERIRSARSAARLRPSRHRNGARISAERDDDDHRGQRGVAQAAEDVVRGEEEQRGADHQQDAEDAAVEVGERELAAASGRRRRSPGAGASVRRAARAGPARPRRERPHSSAAPKAASTSGQTSASLHQIPSCAEGQQRRQRQQPDAGRDAPVAPDLRQATKPSERRPSCHRAAGRAAQATR